MYNDPMRRLSLEMRIPLQRGASIPILGLGTWRMAEGRETFQSVRYALEVGYRHIDTAKLYGNERSVGEAVRESGITREDMFVTTKLWPTNFLNPEAGFRASFERLNIGYIDLYLIHWPVPMIPKKVWQTLEKLYEEGATRAIGVSNYSIDDIEKVLSYARIPPMVNQVEFNAEVHDFDLLEYCKKKNIVVEAYQPVTRGRLFNHPTVQTLARKYSKTPAQLLIRWCLEHGTVPLPKSSNPAHITENAQVFDFSLSKSDMEALDHLR